MAAPLPVLGRVSGWLRRSLSGWSGPFTSTSPEFAKIFGDSSATDAGLAVTEEKAMAIAAVWRAVAYISGQIAGLPFLVYEFGDDRTRVRDHPVARLLQEAPNDEQTPYIFREQLTARTLLWGNGYAEIERNGLGQPVALWPIEPERVSVYRDARTHAVRYSVTQPSGGDVTIDAENMLHVPGLSFDGLVGLSVIAFARQSMGLGLAAEKFGARFFGAGATFGGTFTTEKTLTPGARKTLEKWLEKYAGIERSHKFVLLEQGLKYERLGIPPEDAQFLETRKFQTIEVSRWFGVPPHKLFDLERATYSNIEQQGIDVWTDTLRTWAIRWEQEVNRKLLNRTIKRLYAEHLLDAFLRADQKTRYDAYAVGRQWGWLSVNRILALENQPGIGAAGDQYLTPTNMLPAGAPAPAGGGRAETDASNGVELREAVAEASILLDAAVDAAALALERLASREAKRGGDPSQAEYVDLVGPALRGLGLSADFGYQLWADSDRDARAILRWGSEIRSRARRRTRERAAMLYAKG